MVCHELQSFDRLRVERVADPRPNARQVLIEVAATGLSFLDVLIVSGTYQVIFEAPFIPCGEFAGRILEVGSEVKGLRAGTIVVGETVVGALAERVVAYPEQLVPLPGGIALPVAATMLQSYSTAVYALTRRTSVTPGDRVLVLGAGGGVGLACVDVGVSLGAEVIAVASSAEKRDLAASRGAAAVIDPGSEDVKSRARELSAGGVDIVVDPVGGGMAERALRALGYGGRYLVVGFASGEIPSIPLNLVLLNNRTVVGVELGAETARNRDLATRINHEVVESVNEGRFRPIVPTMVSLEDAGRALQSLRNGEIAGKVAVDIGLASLR